MIDVSCSVAHSRRDLSNPAINPCDSTVRWSSLLPPASRQQTQQNREHTQSYFYCQHAGTQWVRKIGLPIGKNRKYAYIEYVMFASLAGGENSSPSEASGRWWFFMGRTDIPKGIATRCLLRAQFSGGRSLLMRRARL